MRENFKFNMVPNVPANAEFFYLKDSAVTCKRIGSSEKVRYNYGVHSLSSAAMAACKNLYGKDASLCGPEYWIYNGKTLNEWRVENEQKEVDKTVTVTKPLLSIKKVMDFIENYPIVSLKNWGDTFYGYPEEILEKMWDKIGGSEEEKLKKKFCVLDDFGLQAYKFLIKKGISPENIYFCISKEDENFLEIVKAIYSRLPNSDKICSIFSLKSVFGDSSMFDVIIANPPFDRSLHAKILQSIYSTCKNSKIVYLCPDSLLSGMSANCVNARKCTEEALSDYEFLGPVDFEGAKPVVSLFVFDLHSTKKKTFEDCRNSKRSEEEKSIRGKIDSTDCWDPYKLSKTYNFTNTYSEWDENKSGNFRDWLKQKLDFSNPKRVFITSTSALYYKQIAQVGEYPSYVAAYFQFETIEEANQFREVIKDPFYSQILKIYSTNKRDLCPRQAKWPKSIEALNLTQKELEFINGL